MRITETEKSNFLTKYNAISNIFTIFEKQADSILIKRNIINLFNLKEIYSENVRDEAKTLISYAIHNLNSSFYSGGYVPYSSDTLDSLEKYGNPGLLALFAASGMTVNNLFVDFESYVSDLASDVKKIMEIDKAPNGVLETQHFAIKRHTARNFGILLMKYRNSMAHTIKENPSEENKAKEATISAVSIENLLKSGILKELDFKRADADLNDIKKIIDNSINLIIKCSDSPDTIVSMKEQFPDYIGYMFALFNPNKAVLEDNRIQKIIRDEYSKHERAIQVEFFKALWATKTSDPFENLINILVYDNSRISKSRESAKAAKIISTFLLTNPKDADWTITAIKGLSPDFLNFTTNSILPFMKKHPEVINEELYSSILARTSGSVVKSDAHLLIGYVFYTYFKNENNYNEICQRVKKNPAFYTDVFTNLLIGKETSEFITNKKNAIYLLIAGLTSSLLGERSNIYHNPDRKYMRIIEAYATALGDTKALAMGSPIEIDLSLKHIAEKYEEIKDLLHPAFADALIEKLHFYIRHNIYRYLRTNPKVAGTYGRISTPQPRLIESFTFTNYDNLVMNAIIYTEVEPYIKLWKAIPDQFWEQWKEFSLISEKDSFSTAYNVPIYVDRFNSCVYKEEYADLRSPYQPDAAYKVLDGSLFSALIENPLVASIDRYGGVNGNDPTRFITARVIHDISSDTAINAIKDVVHSITTDDTIMKIKMEYVNAIQNNDIGNQIQYAFSDSRWQPSCIPSHPRSIEAKKEYDVLPLAIMARVSIEIQKDLIELYTGPMPEIEENMNDLALFVSSMLMA